MMSLSRGLPRSRPLRFVCHGADRCLPHLPRTLQAFGTQPSSADGGERAKRQPSSRCQGSPAPETRATLRRTPPAITDVFPGNDRSLEDYVESALRSCARTDSRSSQGRPGEAEKNVEKTAERTAVASLAERADFESWLELAREVEPLFGPMAHDPVFQRALLRNIARGTAFCIRENSAQPGSRLLGGLLLSRRAPLYRVGWLAVTESERRSGLGRALLDRALSEIPPEAEVLVITFGPDVPEGRSAREFYKKMGFTPAEMADAAPNGASRQVFRRRAGQSDPRPADS